MIPDELVNRLQYIDGIIGSRTTAARSADEGLSSTSTSPISTATITARSIGTQRHACPSPISRKLSRRRK